MRSEQKGPPARPALKLLSFPCSLTNGKLRASPEPSYAPSITLVHFVHELPIGVCLRVCLAMDAKGQTLYEKVAQSAFVLGVGQETQQSPDLSGERSGPVQSETSHAEKVDHRSTEI